MLAIHFSLGYSALVMWLMVCMSVCDRNKACLLGFDEFNLTDEVHSPQNSCVLQQHLCSLQWMQLFLAGVGMQQLDTVAC